MEFLEELEKFCIAQVNEAGAVGRNKRYPENHPTVVHAMGRMEAYSVILMKIARENAKSEGLKIA